MRNPLVLLLIFVTLLAVPFGARYLQYYRLGRPERPLPAQFDPSAVAQVTIPDSAEFVDEPTVGEGLVLLDMSHANDFTMEEIGYLDGRLAQRGFELLPFTGGDLSTALRAANAFVVVTPLEPFTENEVTAVADFVNRGGRLLMIGDPTRFEIVIEEDLFSFVVNLETDEIPLNSLANEFDIVFNGDYLYNTIENEGNFRNILLKGEGFSEDRLTDGLQQLAFYGAHSLQVGPEGTILLAGDDNTWSSDTDRPGGLALAALSTDDRVLALGDIHFFTEPYYTVFDNGRFIAQIADFLTNTAERQFVLADFPYFFGPEVALVYVGSPELGADAFDEIINLQDAFRDSGQTLSLVANGDETGDALYLGIYNQATELAELLETAGITLVIDPPILAEEPAETADSETAAEADDEPTDDERANGQVAQRFMESALGRVQLSGTALILLDETDAGRQVVVLAASGEGLETAVERLLDATPINGTNAFADCLIQATLALCPTNITNEPVEAELITGQLEDLSEDEEADADEETEDDEDPDEAPETPEGEEGETDQGIIEIGDEISAELGVDERHAYTFDSGPAVIDIAVQSGEDFDAVVEVFDSEGEFVSSSDGTFTEGLEEILELEVPADEAYRIVVRDFYDDGGSYTISVTGNQEEEEADQTDEETIFLFVDDDGTPLSAGINSADAIVSRLEAYETTVWVSSIDGPLSIEELVDVRLLIWDTGDYEDPDGFLGADTEVILEYLDGGGDLLLTGSIPAVFAGSDLSPLSEVEVAGSNEILLAGLTVGDVIPLDQTYETAVLGFGEDDEDAGEVIFARSAESEQPGDIVATAIPEDEFNPQNAVIMLFPFVALPDNIQDTLLNNVLNWFGFDVS